MAGTDFMVIDITATGEAHAMHRDQFNLGFLGKQEITRASDIRFDDATQLWDCYLYGGPVHDADAWYCAPEAKGFATYDLARKVEVEWLEQAALADVPPLSDKGITLLTHAKEKFNDLV